MNEANGNLVSLGLNERTLRLNGSTYKAVDAKPGRCTAGPRCEFAVGFGCELLERTASNWCQPKNRQDSQFIVWVRFRFSA